MAPAFDGLTGKRGRSRYYSVRSLVNSQLLGRNPLTPTKIESSHSLARYWGLRKNRSAMNYDKLSRSLRQYYKKGIIRKPEKKQRLVYKFLPPYNL
jgi:hypothetical protein